MGFDDVCSSGLVLELGLSSSRIDDDDQKPVNLQCFKFGDLLGKTTASHVLDPSLTLSLSGCEIRYDCRRPVVQKINHHPSADTTPASPFYSTKRERVDLIGCDDGELTERTSSKVISDEDDDGGINGRKKLRLSKSQSALLEECFRQHSTLNPKEKQELARELKLRPRQVEVWFQNRRARTKLKQTEVDCEFLKKCCETLTDENKRLQKELEELKAMKLSQPFSQLQAATLTMCPSCERTNSGGNENPSKSSFSTSLSQNPHHYIYKPFPNPSAAC